MRKKSSIRFLCLALCLVICLSLLPTSALAEGEIEEAAAPDAPVEEPADVPSLEGLGPDIPAEEPAEEASEEPTEEPAAEPVEAPVEEPVEAPVEEPVEAPVEEPVEEPAEEPVEEPIEEPVEEPAEEPVEEPIEEPVEEPAEEPIEEPAEEPIEEPIEEPVEEPIEEPAEEPVEEPIEEPEGELEVEQEEDNAKDEAALSLVTDPAGGTAQTIQGTIYSGASFNAKNTSDTLVLYYRFIPVVTDTYSFYAEAYDDTVGYLYDSDWKLITYDDDSNGNYNFLIEEELTAGTTYFFGATFYEPLVDTIPLSLTKAKTGWCKQDGNWYYFNADSKPASGIQTVGGKEYGFSYQGKMIVGSAVWNGADASYYFCNTDGIVVRKAGWHHDADGDWYYAPGADGKLLNCEWKKINGVWYYFEPVMVSNGHGHCYNPKTDDYDLLYFFLPSGAWDSAPGWKTDAEGDVYYADSSGRLLTGWQTIGGKTYYFDTECGYRYAGGVRYVDEDDRSYFFDDNGVLVNDGWGKVTVEEYGETETLWFYVENGETVSGWKKIGGKWYYFVPEYDHYMVTGPYTVDGKLYFFTASGALAGAGWQKLTRIGEPITYWWYTDSKGVIQTGWKTIGGKTYYFHPERNGMMVTGPCSVGGTPFLFGLDGAQITGKGWQSITVPAGYEGPNSPERTFWWYLKDGGEVRTGWLKDNNKWYYLHPITGIMVADEPREIDGKTYFFNASGVMQTGWCRDDWSSSYKTWTESGTDWYYADKNGVLQTGWKTIGGKTYYFEPGYWVMVTGVYSIDGKPYFFSSSGVLAGAGWQAQRWESNGESRTSWYFTNADGTIVTGWKRIGGKWYYFGDSMYTGLCQVDGQYEFFGSDGVWVPAGENSVWRLVGGKLRYMENGSYVTGWKELAGEYYYFKSNGDMADHEWVKTAGKWYYVGPEMYAGDWWEINGRDYYFNAKGVMQTGWIKYSWEIKEDAWHQTESFWMYADQNGVLQTDWQEIGGKTYYFAGDHAMYFDATEYIDGHYYTFDANGVCQNPPS